MRKEVEKKIKLELDQLETVNIGLDGCSDKVQLSQIFGIWLKLAWIVYKIKILIDF